MLSRIKQQVITVDDDYSNGVKLSGVLDRSKFDYARKSALVSDKKEKKCC